MIAGGFPQDTCYSSVLPGRSRFIKNIAIFKGRRRRLPFSTFHHKMSANNLTLILYTHRNGASERRSTSGKKNPEEETVPHYWSCLPCSLSVETSSNFSCPTFATPGDCPTYAVALSSPQRVCPPLPHCGIWQLQPRGPRVPRIPTQWSLHHCSSSLHTKFLKAEVVHCNTFKYFTIALALW